MSPTLLLLTALSLPLLPTSSAAAALLPRAGAPIPKLIPANCTVINPLPHAACGIANVHGYQPSPAFLKHNLLYSAYFNNTSTPAEEAKFCSQQCYGYGYPGTCNASFVAFNVPVPAGTFGTSGGEPSTACLLFAARLTPLEFVRASPGEYVNATAASIYCPSV